MDWRLASLIMFVSSVLLYLLVRKSQLGRVSNTLINISMFGVPCVIIFFINLLQNTLFSVTPTQLTLLAFTAFFFSYLGNILSLKGMGLAPNPGYSLILSKSYVVYTTLFAVILLNSSLTLKNLFAILLIVSFSVLMAIPAKGDKPGRTAKGKRWIAYSIGAFIAWGNLALMAKLLFNQGLQVTVYLFYLTLFVSIFIILQTGITKERLDIKRKDIRIIAGIGILSAAFNLFLTLGIMLAPNPGYVNAVNASSISLITLFSAFLFKDQLSSRKVIGIVGVTLGMILLFL